MTSELFNRSHPSNFAGDCSPESMYHFPMSPSEPGKFDFYRVHLANHACHSDSKFSDHSDAPTLSASSSITQRRWTPFADIGISNQSKPSSSLNSIPISKSQTVSSMDSSFVSNTNSSKTQPIQSVGSLSSLTDIVKNAMNKGHLSAPSKQMQRPASGTTLSSKDLNHLSPQSM